MNSFEGRTMVIALTPKDGDMIVDVGCKTAKAPGPDAAEMGMEMEFGQMAKNEPDVCDASEQCESADEPVRKSFKIPEGVDDRFILPVPGPGAVTRLKARIVRAFAKLYGMEVCEVESLFDFEEMNDVIEENADVFWAMDPKQVAVAIHRRIVRELYIG